MNYALVPDCQFPVPLIQMNQAMAFLLNEANKLGLNMDKVHHNGCSAGANLTAQYATLMSNKEYIDLLNIIPVLSLNQVKAVIIDDVPLIFDHFALGTKLMVGSYLNSSIFLNKSLKKKIDVIFYVNQDFSTAYLIGSNYTSKGYAYDMEKLSGVLSNICVKNSFYYQKHENGTESKHGFMWSLASDPYAHKAYDGNEGSPSNYKTRCNMLEVYDLKTEYLSSPLGIDEKYPRLSWKLRSDGKGLMQISYRIQAFSENELIWDSGQVKNNQSQRIRYAGSDLQSRQIVNWQVEVTVEDDNGNQLTSKSDWASFEMGLLHKSDWKAQWIEAEEEFKRSERQPVIYLRHSFEVKPGLVKARIYQTAHGLYETWLNGSVTSQDKFKPGLTSYYHRIQYQVHDITSLLNIGQNAWATQLADGWWKGTTGGTVQFNFGYKLHYFGQIELYYQDGSTDIISTGEYFKQSRGGLITSDMMMGDIYDARLEPLGWKSSVYDDGAWTPVHLAKEHFDADLIATRSVPVREKEVFKPEIFTDSKGNTVLDFGQNIAGYVKMTLRNCTKGQKVRLVHGEDIKDGAFNLDNIYQLSLEVDAFQEVTYICKGESEESYCPNFSIFGFRYVLLEGYDGDIKADDFLAVAVYSDMTETGSFTSSNPLLNKLVENSLWSQKGNYMDVPVDCPTRERNAWTGDAQIYTPTATKFMDVYSFYEKWLIDQSIEQYDSGKLGITFPSTSSVHNPAELEIEKQRKPMSALAGPTGDGNIGEDCAGWGDSSVWIPYMIYLNYGDIQILKNQYQTAKKWVDYMLRCAKDPNPLYENLPQYHSYNEDGELEANYIYDTRMHYGEWQEPIQKEKTDEDLAAVFVRMMKEGKPLVATAYMFRSSDNLAHMAEILGYDEDALHYKQIASKIRNVYNKYLIAEDGTIEPGHQAAYVRVLAMNLVNDEKKELVIQKLVEEIKANDFRLNTGFLSTPFILPVLADNGYVDLAFRILLQTEKPSWLHPVLLGSTTILESWDGMDKHDGSYNHYSYGAVCQFLFEYVAGIKPSFDYPGYERFVLEPVLSGDFTFAKASYESNYGPILSEWEIVEEECAYTCHIPVNAQAELRLPNGEILHLLSGKYHFNFKWTN